MSSFLGWPKVQGEEAGTGGGPHAVCVLAWGTEERQERAKEHEGWAHSYLQKEVLCSKHFPTSHM